MIELQVYGDPAACRTAAQQARAVATKIDEAVASVRRASATSDAAWQGGAGEGFRATLDHAQSGLADLADRITPACSALDTFADELQVVKTRLADVGSTAAGAGLTVSGDAVSAPDEPGDSAPQGQVDDYNTKVKAYNDAVSAADAARDKESEAHEHLTAAMATSNGDGWFENLMEKLGFLPSDGSDALDTSAWLFGLGGLGFGVATSTMLKGVLQQFQPRVAGRFGTASGMSFWQRLAAGASEDSWHAKAYQAISRDRWAAAGKWAGRAGTVVTAATSAWDQWQTDADDPSLDTGERVDRAATKGVTTAAGAWAGAEVGAWAGGAIGTAICPGVGTVVGGAVGGLIGGFAGSSAGGWVGDQINDAADGVGHLAADVGGAVADKASDVGDALTFWD